MDRFVSGLGIELDVEAFVKCCRGSMDLSEDCANVFSPDAQQMDVVDEEEDTMMMMEEEEEEEEAGEEVKLTVHPQNLKVYLLIKRITTICFFWLQHLPLVLQLVQCSVDHENLTPI